jgi:hypothetical protein
MFKYAPLILLAWVTLLACKHSSDSLSAPQANSNEGLQPHPVPATPSPSASVEVIPTPVVGISGDQTPRPAVCSALVDCPPSIRPVRCTANEIGGSLVYYVDSAPNHCVGVARLRSQLCHAGRKLADFAISCRAKGV